MQNTVSDLQNQQAAMSSLEATFSALQNAIQNVSAAAGGSMGATVSDPSSVSATVTSGALVGTYGITVDTMGSSTTALSGSGSPPVTDPTKGGLSSSTSYSLTFNGTAHQITTSDTSLASLASAINDAGLGVQATIVNLGSNSSPDYRLAVTSNELGADTIQLSDGTNNNMLSTLATGADATYRVTGSNQEIQTNTRQVTLAPGLTVNLLAPSTNGQAATITVAQNNNNMVNALSNFASAYNSAVDALSAQRGQNAGPLLGQSLVFTLSNMLSSINGYTNGSSGSVGSLSDLGFTLDQTGHLSFSAATFSGANADDIQQFLGTTTSGGFVQMVNDTIGEMADPTTGVIQGDLSSLQDQITAENSQMADEQSRINDLTTNLQTQLAQADAAIATMQEQKTYFADLFQAEFPASSSSSNA